MLIKNCKRPLNETEIHYELKQIAKYILKSKGYHIIGEEIDIGMSTYLKDYKQFNLKKALYKNTIDVVGIKNKGTFYSYQNFNKNKFDKKDDSEFYFKDPQFNTIGIESKASLKDFKNGFCCTCEKTFIIAPKGIIPIKMIPNGIGLIEVDLNKYKISYQYLKFNFNDVETMIKAKTRIDDRFIDNENNNKNGNIQLKPIYNLQYQHWVKDLLRQIAYKHTNKDIFKNNQIIIQSRNWDGNKE